MRLKKIIILVYLCFFVLLCLTITSTADPIPRDVSSPSPTVRETLLLIPWNYLPDTVFVAGPLLALLYFSKYQIRVESSYTFIGKILGVGVLIDCMGALIDTWFVKEPLYFFLIAKYYPCYSLDLASNFLSLFIALVLIFLSFFVLCKWIIKIGYKHASMTGGIAVILNIVLWAYYLINPNASWHIWMVFAVAFCIVIPWLFWKHHKKVEG